MHPGPSRAPTPWPGLRRHGTTFARPINRQSRSTPPSLSKPAPAHNRCREDCRSRQDFLSLAAATHQAYHAHLVDLDHTTAVHNAADVLGRHCHHSLARDARCCHHYFLQPTQTVTSRSKNAGCCILAPAGEVSRDLDSADYAADTAAKHYKTHRKNRYILSFEV